MDFVPNNLVMTWGGLRGGISIAAGFGVWLGMHGPLFLVINYVVVVILIIRPGIDSW